jgi:hypothetical protein
MNKEFYIMEAHKREVENLMKYLGALQFRVSFKNISAEVARLVDGQFSFEEIRYSDRAFILKQDGSVSVVGMAYATGHKLGKREKEIKISNELLKDLIHHLRLKVRTKAMAKAIENMAAQELKYCGIVIPNDEMYIPFVIYDE